MKRAWRRRWIRWHSWLGVVLAPYLLLYGVSSLLLAHPSVASGGSERTWQRDGLSLPARSAEGTAAELRAELQLVGRIWDVQAPASPGEPLRFFLERPGRTYHIDWFEAESRVEVLEWDGGLGHILRLLHGLHELPGSTFELAWAGYTYLSMLGLPFLVLSGIWLELPRWRRRPRTVSVFAASTVLATILMLWLVAR